MPEKIYDHIPEKPRIEGNGLTCEVYVQAYVDEAGAVKDAKILKCNRPNMGFEEAALDAAYQCRYKPAVQNGQPVGVWVSYRVEFKYE